MKILVTGSTGFLGRHTLPILINRYGSENVIGVSSDDYDLMNYSEVERMFDDIHSDVVVHYAAYSGGIGANKAYPADFYFINTILTANVFQCAAKHKIKKMIYTMGGCAYPASAVSPISEDQMWSGYPQSESAGYSTAKKMGIVAAKSYKEQYGLDATVLVPGNMYGEFDNFNNIESHVIPAMIRRYFEANRNATSNVEMWGTGSPERDFVYAGDVAKTIPFFIENYNDVGPINISSGVRTSIKDLALTIAKLVDYKGEIIWNTSKPDGQMVKIFDTAKLSALGLSCSTELETGLRKTIKWFSENYAKASDGLRL